MARNRIKLSAVIEEYLAERTEASYDKDLPRDRIVMLAKSGLRRIASKIGTNLKTVRIDIADGNTSVELPSDYLQYSKIGVVNSDGLVETLTVNNDIVIAPEQLKTNGVIDKDAWGVDEVGSPVRSGGSLNDPYYMYLNYMHQGRMYHLYGATTDNNPNGYFRINEEFNRIEIGSVNASQIILEYDSDPTMSGDDFEIQEPLAEPLKRWIYSRAIMGKRGVPATERQLAQMDYGRALSAALSEIQPIRINDIAAAYRHWNKQTAKG